MVVKMAKRPPKKNKVEIHLSLALCEGESEVWFLESLGFKNFKAQKAKNRDVENIVIQAANLPLRDYKTVYCVFDKDDNTDQQLDVANKRIKENTSLVRVYSLPNFEVIFYLAKNQFTQDEGYDFDSYISKNYLNSEKYQKTEKQIKLIASQIDFKQLCINSEAIYKKIGVDNNNWKQSIDSQAYSEIFQLKDLVS